MINHYNDMLSGEPPSLQEMDVNSFVHKFYDLVLYANSSQHAWLLENIEQVLEENNQLMLLTKKRELDSETSIKMERIQLILNGFYAPTIVKQIEIIQESNPKQSSMTSSSLSLLKEYSPSITKTSLFARKQELSKLEIEQKNDAEYFELLYEIKKHNEESLSILVEKGENAISFLQEEIESSEQSDDLESRQLLSDAIGYWRKVCDYSHAKKDEKELIEDDLTNEEQELVAIFGNR
ncbi:MAG: hypothetical protein LRY67_06525 [Gammaproteobacteria bacterium]|nr:hypothetical protein [Gammaproteobacteria bacterium]